MKQVEEAVVVEEMSTKYSAHPALAAEQLQHSLNATSLSKATLTQHRRHKSASGLLTHKTTSGSACDAKLTTNRSSSSSSSGVSTPTKSKSSPNNSVKRTSNQHDKNHQSKSQNSTTQHCNRMHVEDKFLHISNPTITTETTKDCQLTTDTETSTATAIVTSAAVATAASSALNTITSLSNATAPIPSPIDETDHLQHRFSRNAVRCSSSIRSQFQHEQLQAEVFNTSTLTDGCVSDLSSAFSSPSPSTDSTPLSTPTRLPQQLQLQHVHQHCCQKAISGACGSSSSSHHHHHHTHHHHHHTSTATSCVTSKQQNISAGAAVAGGANAGCKKWQKFDPRLGPSPYRQLLPIALCILSFATVFATLIVYMDTTEIRHQQFRLNMSRDYELSGVAQDDPALIAFLREIHMRKYPIHFLKSRDTSSSSSSIISGTSINDVVDQHWNFSAHHDELTPEMAYYVADLVGNKRDGAVIQSMTGSVGQLLTAPWLAETLNWMGVIIEPEPKRYFTLRRQTAPRGRMQVVHACVSPTPYPKEVTIHYENADVRINSLHDEETSWFNSRVKCFPLYTIMLACERVKYDLLSLGVHGHELEILQTLPFDQIEIEIISIHLPEDQKDIRNYIQTITKFLAGKSYKLQRKFGRNYFFQRISSTSRTRKKDILLLKTP